MSESNIKDDVGFLTEMMRSGQVPVRGTMSNPGKDFLWHNKALILEALKYYRNSLLESEQREYFACGELISFLQGVEE